MAGTVLNTKNPIAVETLMNRFPGMFCIIEPGGRFLYLNPEWENVLGYSLEEMMSLTLFELIHPDDLEKSIILIQNPPTHPAPSHLTVQMKCKTGTIKIVKFKFSDIFENKRFALATDITEHRKKEQTLKESQEKYYRLVSTIPHGIQEIDLQGRIIFCNDAFLKMTGYRYEEIIGKCFWEFTHEPPGEKVKSRFLELIRIQQEPERFVEKKICRDGKIIDVHIHWSYKYNSSHVLEGIVAVITDVTEQQKTYQALSESEEKYRRLFEMESDAIFLIDKETGKILEVNPAASKIYGFTREELLKMKNTDVSAESEQTHQATRDKLTTIPVRYHWKKNGEVFPVEIAASHLLWKGREAHIASIRDISLRVKADEERVKIQEQLYRADKLNSLGTLAGGIAHDFNNILSGILGYSQLIRLNLNHPEKIEKNIDQVQKGAQKAADLVQQILTFSRKSTVSKQPVAVHLIVREAINLLKSSIPSTIEIRQHIISKAAVMADPGRIHQVIMNLSTNAYHAMIKKGGILSVTLDEADPSDIKKLPGPDIHSRRFLELEIRDTGHGIIPEIMNRIFEPYFTTKEPGKGTGLGLSVVFSIIQDHSGHITVASEPGQGTTFTVYLPIIDAIASVETEIRPMPGTEHILFVDDETVVSIAVKELLEDLGYSVTAFQNGADAFEAFQKAPDAFDIVVTDMTMPGITGLDLAKHVIQIAPHKPVILCTGYSDLIDRESALKSGMAGYYEKPYDINKLAGLIRSVLDEQKTNPGSQHF